MNFDSLIGQVKAKKMLTRAAAGDKMSHAYLFRGPAGVGKKTMARIFGTAVNCAEPQDGKACGRCTSCRKFSSGNHPDFISIEPDGAAIKIKQIRELKQALAYAPYEAQYRVVILSDIQTMRREAANSLLKTLEEPPPGNLLILCADESGAILPTIKSRCQNIPFYALPYTGVEEILVNDGIDAEEAATLTAVAEGSIGLARILAEKELLPVRRHIIDTLISARRENPQTPEIILQLAEETAKLKENLDDILDLLKIWFRDLLIHRHRVPDMVINRDLQELLPQAAVRWQNADIGAKIHHIDQARRQLARHCNRTLVCEVLFFALLC